MRRLRMSSLQFLLALMLSLALWTFVSFTENPTQLVPFTVPVNLIEPSAGLIAVSPETGLPLQDELVNPETGLPLQDELTTDIAAAVAERDVPGVRAASFAATADLSNLGTGDHIVPIEVTPPPGVRIRTQQPQTLTVRIVPQQTRRFAVEVAPRNRPAFLFEANDITVATSQTTVTGPEDLVERVARAIVPVDLEGRTSTFTEELPIEAVDANGLPVPGVTIVPARARVTVPVTPRVNVQRVAVLPRVIGQPAPGYTTERGNERIDWNPKYVELIAPVEITTTLETEPIDLTGRTESFTQTVRLDNLDDPNIKLLTSDVITVTVPIVPFETPSLGPVFVPVTIVNLGPELQATPQPLGFTVTARGTAAQFRQLESQPVQALVDVRGLGPGVYTLGAVVQLPGGLQIVGNQPQVTVTITAAPAAATPIPEPGG